MELLLLTVANENETKTHKYQFQFTDNVDITMNDTSSLGKFSIPGSDFSLDSFFSIQKVVITQPSHLIIKNISKVDYDFETLKGKLKKFGKITELRIVDDCTKKDNYICFVNFANKEDAFKCIQQVTAEKHWFANYHIERLERDKLLYLDTKHESSEKEFTKVHVSLQNNVDQKKLQKQIKTQNTKVILPPFESLNDEFKINQFDGFKLYSSVSKLLEEKNLHNDVASFTYNHGYFLIKFAKHEQALDCINHLDNVELNFLDETRCLKPHRANVRKSVGKGKRDSLALDTEKIASYQSNSMTEIFKNRQSLKNKNSFSIQSLESRSSSISSTCCSPKFKSFNEVGSSSSLMDLPSPPMKDASPLTTFGANFNEKMFTNNEFFPVPIPVPYPVLMTPMNTFAMPPPPFLNYSLQPPSSYNYSTKPLSPKTDVNKSMNWSYPIPTSVHQHSNLYFQNLPLSWTDKDLFDFVVSYLEQTGDFEEPEKEIISYKVITQNFHDKQHKGKSKGYAFVSFRNPLVASKCAYDMHMYKLEESEYDNESERKQSVESVDVEDRFKLRVSFAKKRGRSLELANSKPITMNKQFMECLDSIM